MPNTNLRPGVTLLALCSPQKKVNVPGCSPMHDTAELVLTGKLFIEQPGCWQNMVNHLSHNDPYFHTHFYESIHKHLKKFNLQFVNNEYPEPSVVKGTRTDLTAWMLSYA